MIEDAVYTNKPAVCLEKMQQQRLRFICHGCQNIFEIELVPVIVATTPTMAQEKYLGKGI